MIERDPALVQIRLALVGQVGAGIAQRLLVHDSFLVLTHRDLAQPELLCVRGGSDIACVGSSLTIIGSRLTVVGLPLAPVGPALTPIGPSLPVVGLAFPLVGALISLVSKVLTVRSLSLLISTQLRNHRRLLGGLRTAVRHARRCAFIGIMDSHPTTL